MRRADDSIDVPCDSDDVGRGLADDRDGEMERWKRGERAEFDVVNGRLGNRDAGQEHRETFCGVYGHPCRFAGRS
jgi:hypothetical protein